MTTARVAEVITEAVVASDPGVRVAEVIAETVVTAPPSARVGEVIIEVVVQGPIPKGRLSRFDAEVLAEVDSKGRVSRVDAEVLSVIPSKARVSRADAETLVNFPSKGRASRLSVEVLVPTRLLITIIEGTADDATFSGDVAAASIAWAGRDTSDSAPEPGDAETHTKLLARSGADTAGGTDTAFQERTTHATAGDSVPVPTDAAVGAIGHIFFRTGTEFLDRPADSVETFTYVTAFRPSFEPPGRRLVKVRPNQVTIGPTAMNWSSDVAVSKPRAYSMDRPVLVDFGGFGFTTGGLAHNITEAEAEEQFIPIFAPEEVDDGS